MTTKPLLSGTAALVVGTIGTLAAAAAVFVPHPWGGLVAVVAFIAASLAGFAVAPPKLTEGRPVLQGGLLTGAVALLGVLAEFWSLLPPGWPQSVAAGAAALLAWLTGRALPPLGIVAGQPAQAPTGQPPAPATPEAAADTFNRVGPNP